MLKEFKFKSSEASRVFLTSDTHYNHSKAPEKRGFTSLTEHDPELIKRHNNKVRPQDKVIHCGDFLFEANEELFYKYVNQLNGHIYLLWGNHNSGTKQAYRRLVSDLFGRDDVEVYPTIYYDQNGKEKVTFVGDYIKGWINSTPFVASHFAFRVWDFMQKNAVCFSGHSHGSDKKSNPDWPRHKRCDVGVDNFDFAPVAFEDLMVIMDNKALIQLDHHDKHTTSSF